MTQESLTIRNYEKGDDVTQANIFNTVIVDMIPDPVLINAEKVQKRHEEAGFNPEQVKYLVNSENKIVGYTGRILAEETETTSAARAFCNFIVCNRVGIQAGIISHRPQRNACTIYRH